MADSNTKTTVTLEVNGTQAQNTLDGLRKIAEQTRQAMDKAAAAGDRITLNRLRKELNRTEKSIKDMESTGAHLQKVMANLGKASPNELQRTLTILKKQLNYIERGSKEWNEQIDKIKRVKAEIQTMNASMSEGKSLGTKITDEFNKWMGAVGAAVLAVTGVIAAGKQAVEAYASMQQEEANVRKYTGMTEEQVRSLNDAFKQMDTRTSREELNKLAQEAGRLGMSSEEDVLGFVRAADKINVALDELGEGATLELSKLTDIFGLKDAEGVEQSLLKVGSVINELSQNSTASASYLQEFATRMSGVGKVAKMTVPEIMGFAAVLDSNGQQLEMSASALQKLTIDMFQNSGKIAKAVGLDVKEFSDLAKNDANEALLVLLQRLHELGGIDTIAPIFKDMGENGVRMQGVLAALANNVDNVRAQQEAANVAYQEGISINKEFEVQNTTVQAGLEKARKNLTEVAVSLGEKLLPIMSTFISKTSLVLKVLSSLVDVVFEYKGVILASAAAVATYTAATKASEVAKKAWSAVVKVATTVQEGLNTAMKHNLFGLIAAAVAAAVVALKSYIDKLNAAKEAADVVGQMNKRVNETMSEEKAKIESLRAVYLNHNVSMERRLKAYKELQSIVPGYTAEIDKEGKVTKENTKAIEDYCKNLEKKARYEAAYEMMVEKQRELAKAQMEKDDAEIEAEAKQIEWAKMGDKRDAAGNKQWNPKKDAAWNDYLDAKKEADEADERIKTAEAQVKKLNKILGEYATSGTTAAATSSSTGAEITGVATTSLSGKEEKDPTKPLRAARAREETELLASYARREINKEQYEARMVEIERKFYADALALQGLSTEKRTELTNQSNNFELKQTEKAAKEQLAAEKVRIDGLKAQMEEEYNEGKITEEQYREEVFKLEAEYFDKRIEYERQFGSAEAVETEKRLAKAKHESEQRKKLLEKQKEEREAVRGYMHDAFGAGTDEDEKEYNKQLALFKQAQAKMLAAAGDDNKKRLEIEEAGEIAILELKKKYFQITNEEYERALGQRSDALTKWLETRQGQAVMQSADLIVQGMSNIFSEIQSLIDAEVEQQTDAIETEYDSMISAAEGNKYKEAQLEQEKEDKIAAIKNEASQKSFNMEVISATAQGAMAAINAYSSAAAIPMVGYLMAPAAAAMALLATGLQIANLKAEKDAAASSGYAEGGFTSPGKKYDVAGVVHAGEWVASQELVNSPVARPIINSLEQAQRTNSIASLNSRDVSESITAPITLARAAKNSGQSSDNVASTLSALNKRLNEPFVTVNTVTGDNGINKAMRRYEKLKANK